MYIMGQKIKLNISLDYYFCKINFEKVLFFSYKYILFVTNICDQKGLITMDTVLTVWFDCKPSVQKGFRKW